MKKFIVGIACIAVIGVVAFAFLSGEKLQEPVFTEVIQDVQPPLVEVGEITPLIAITPDTVKPIIPLQQEEKAEEENATVFEPAIDNTDVVVPFIPEVAKPPEAEVDTDKENHEQVEGADESEPPVTQPPRQPVTEPPKQSEPQGGDTNSQGQVWFPGFGWITPGNGNQGERVDSDGDINKQVGEM